jgi:transposase
MVGVYKLDIAESVEDLKQLLRLQRSASDKERIQLLYLLKSEQAKTVQAAAELLGRHRVTVQEWLRLYRQEGLSGLLSHKPRLGQQYSIPQWAPDALNKRLQQEEGFNSYGEICQWLESQLGIVSPYKTVHQLGLTGQVRLLCEDDTRIGLKTISGRKITARGVKPTGKVQWQFRATYLYRVVEPATGAHFFYEFTHFNTDCFQVFFNLVAEHFADSILIIQLDQAGCHRAKRLQIPSNIILMFQPSHSPETNPYAFGGAKPYEQVWQHLKRGLRWKLPQTLDELRLLMRERLQEMTQAVIRSIVARASILEALFVANL